jgi:polygalacturonase
MDDYNSIDAYEQNFSVLSEQWVGKHLILAIECKNVALTGTGTIDGSADAFMGDLEFKSVHTWRKGIRFAKDKEKLRPGQLICFVECERVLVENITLTNYPCWGCFLHGSEYVTVRGVKVFNPDTYANTDGIDIDSCRFVTVSDCNIHTGDDGITVRGATKRLKKKRSLPLYFNTIATIALIATYYSDCAQRALFYLFNYILPKT